VVAPLLLKPPLAVANLFSDVSVSPSKSSTAASTFSGGLFGDDGSSAGGLFGSGGGGPLDALPPPTASPSAEAAKRYAAVAAKNYQVKNRSDARMGLGVVDVASTLSDSAAGAARLRHASRRRGCVPFVLNIKCELPHLVLSFSSD
jgi:hypothetical protein